MHFKKIIPLIIAILAIPLLMMAQVTTSTISGTVKDDKGAVLDGATVKVTNTQNGSVKQTKSDKNGRFTIPNLDPGGPYTVVVSFVGQQIPTRENVFLQLGTTEVLDFAGNSSSNTLEGVVVILT